MLSLHSRNRAKEPLLRTIFRMNEHTDGRYLRTLR